MDAPYAAVNLHFEKRMDYLSCIKAINDAEIAKLTDREEKALALRRALSTVVPRHAVPGSPQPCCVHNGQSWRFLRILMTVPNRCVQSQLPKGQLGLMRGVVYGIIMGNRNRQSREWPPVLGIHRSTT